MKLFLVACLAVAVMAESDPNLLVYNTMPVVSPLGVQPLPVSYIHPTMKVMKEEEKVEEKKVEEDKQQIVYSALPTTYVNPIATPINYYNPLTYTTFPYVRPTIVQKNGEVESRVTVKRDADPYMVYSNLGFRSYLPYATRYVNPVVPAVYNKVTYRNPFTGDVTGKVTNDAILPNDYASKGQYFARAPGSPTVHLAKREADPLTVINSPFYSSLYPTTMYTNPIMYNTPLVYRNPVVTYNKPLGVEGVEEGKTVADDAWQFTPNYAGKGTYVAKTPGSEHVAKREADPLVYYSSGFPSVYSGYYNYPRTAYSGLYNNYYRTPYLYY